MRFASSFPFLSSVYFVRTLSLIEVALEMELGKPVGSGQWVPLSPVPLCRVCETLCPRF